MEAGCVNRWRVLAKVRLFMEYVIVACLPETEYKLQIDEIESV